MSDAIFNTGLTIHAHHGVMRHEKKVGQQFVIDLELAIDLAPAGASDKLVDTVSYSSIVEAASYDNEQRLPEAFAGYDRSAFPTPVRYPVACHPQAWAAGSVPALIAGMCGLRIDAFRRELRLVRPSMLPYVGSLELVGIRVGAASCDLHLERVGDRMSVEVDRLEGELEVLVEQPVARGS